MNNYYEMTLIEKKEYYTNSFNSDFAYLLTLKMVTRKSKFVRQNVFELPKQMVKLRYWGEPNYAKNLCIKILPIFCIDNPTLTQQDPVRPSTEIIPNKFFSNLMP